MNREIDKIKKELKTLKREVARIIGWIDFWETVPTNWKVKKVKREQGDE